MILEAKPYNRPPHLRILLMKADLLRTISRLLLLLLVVGSLSSCSMVQTSMWTSFVDDLGTGSMVEPERNLINAEGVLNVRITKAASPEWVPDKELDYPYAGIMMFLRGWGKPMDLSEADGIIIEYRLNGRLSLKLKQQGMSTGGEYLVELKPSDKYVTRHIPWSDFAQPQWIQDRVDLNLAELIGLMFVNTSEQLSTADLSIKNISFSNWENPDNPIIMMKRLGRSSAATAGDE